LRRLLAVLPFCAAPLHAQELVKLSTRPGAIAAWMLGKPTLKEIQ
jgi:hypothetical protein